MLLAPSSSSSQFTAASGGTNQSSVDWSHLVEKLTLEILSMVLIQIWHLQQIRGYGLPLSEDISKFYRNMGTKNLKNDAEHDSNEIGFNECRKYTHDKFWVST